MNPSTFFDRHALSRTVGVVAVSGGPDSVAVAHLLTQLPVARLVFAHINHQLRRNESDADEEFVRGLPERWRCQASVVTTRIAVAQIAEREADNLESIARRERYRWLVECALAENADWVATGHTADDQAETVLFRLLRGTGVLGLSAMPEVRPLDEHVRLIRPLLSTRRRDVLAYLHDREIPYRVDSSNADPRFTRNRLRHELLPLLEREHNPAVVEVLCRLSEQARELHEEVETVAFRLLADAERPRAGTMLVFAVEHLRGASSNLLREMFRLVWRREGWPMGAMDFDGWQRLVEIAQGARTASDFPGGIQVRRVGAVLRAVRSD